MKIITFLKKIYLKIPHANVFMFHHVHNTGILKSGCVLDEDKFIFFCNTIKNVISIDSLFKKYSKKINKNIITFDDSLEDVYSVAYPILKKRNLPFAIFVLTDMLDTEGYLTTEQLLELDKDKNVTLCVHGNKHRILTELNDKDLNEEIIYSKAKLERLLGHKVNFFAYSHGQNNKNVMNTVKKGGYKAAFDVSMRTFNFIDKHRKFQLGRINVDDETFVEIKKKYL